MLLVLKNIFYIMEESAMPKPGLPRRYLIFLGGVIFTALGVALITLAGMGTSAVSSLSYVLTFVFPGVSFGTFTFIVNASLVVGQILVLRREFKPLQLLQLPATFLFSVSLDLWMYLLGALTPQSYPGRWVFLLLGCICLGIGVALEVLPDVLILPCEGFVNVVSRKYRWDFGLVKTIYDVAMVVSAAIVSLACTGQIHGLREGTLVTALIVGVISRFCCKHLAFLMSVRGGGQPHPC